MCSLCKLLGQITIYAILSRNPFAVINAFFGVKFSVQNFCLCKKNDKYEVWFINNLTLWAITIDWPKRSAKCQNHAEFPILSTIVPSQSKILEVATDLVKMWRPAAMSQPTCFVPTNNSSEAHKRFHPLFSIRYYRPARTFNASPCLRFINDDGNTYLRSKFKIHIYVFWLMLQ